MPRPILYRQARGTVIVVIKGVGHNMLYVSGFIFQSRDCIIPVQNRGNGGIESTASSEGQFNPAFAVMMPERIKGDLFPHTL
jgi:hypothetical protein